MGNSVVRQLEPDLFVIDLDFQGVPGVIASYLLVGDELTLIETGPSTTIDRLLAGVRAAGFAPEQITQLAVTHIHLDHAGAAGVLMRELPRARLLVHEFGAPHLIEPSKLLASATRIFGDDMEQLWGEVAPVPADRVVALSDGAEIVAGRHRLIAVSTPGHASHHFAYHLPESEAIFTGDVAGVRLGASYVRPPTVPPEFDLELWRSSITRLRTLRPERLYLTHFGAFDDPDWHFDDLLGRLCYWTGWVDAGLASEIDAKQVAERLRELGDQEILAATGREDLLWPYELATGYEMTVNGMARYFRRRRG